MQVTQLEWIITLGVTIAVLLFDVIVIGRRPHEPIDSAVLVDGGEIQLASSVRLVFLTRPTTG